MSVHVFSKALFLVSQTLSISGPLAVMACACGPPAWTSFLSCVAVELYTGTLFRSFVLNFCLLHRLLARPTLTTRK